jgi:hypothetical protein
MSSFVDFSDSLFLDFRRAGWGVGPCGSVVKPDLVSLIGGDEEESYYQHVQREVTVGGVFEERMPFSNERCDSRDPGFYYCEVYKRLENDFFLENERVRKTFGENLSLLGSDSDDDDRTSVGELADGSHDDLHQGNKTGSLLTEGVHNLAIERAEPQEAENGGILERKTFEEVVAALDPNFVVDTRRIVDSEVMSEDDILFVVNEKSEETGLSASVAVEGRAVERNVRAVHQEPGLFSGDVDDDDFSPIPRAALFLSFRDEQCEEVSLSLFLYCISVVFCFVEHVLIKISL